MKTLYKLPYAAILLFSLFITTTVQANTIYVDSAAAGSNNGSSWANAFTSFQAGINQAGAGDEVWVAKGTYQPASGQSFSMKSGVKIYGGFANTATLLSDRNWGLNPVILLGNNKRVFNNSNVDINARLDGFTVTGGIDYGNLGGGIYNSVVAAVFANLVIANNSSLYGEGGGIYNSNSSAKFINILFYNNSSDEGGGMDNNNSPVTVTNVTFYGNSASYTSGGLLNYNSAAIVTNCLFWGNTPVDIWVGGSPTPTITNCNTQTFIAGSGNVASSFSLFTNASSPAGADGIFMTADDGLRLLDCSSAINTGNNSANTEATDIAGQPRAFFGNIDVGAYENQATPEPFTLGGNTDTVTQLVGSPTFILAPNSCRVISLLFPAGASPVTDTITSKVWVDGSVQFYNGQPYAQRHYQITPKTGAATATARITLYFLQSEFDAFNAASATHLPSMPVDSAGKADLRIMQFHGTSASGVPGTYSGSTEIIDPADIDISWVPPFNGWQISFNVTGFSGFAVTAGTGSTLPLTLLSFTGQLAAGKALLQWKTTNEVNSNHFEIEKSVDSRHFTLLAKVIALGKDNNTYELTDEQIQAGNNYYRLKSIDNDGKYTYSKIVLIKAGINGTAPFVIYPNPANNQLILKYDNLNSHAQINIYNLDGKKEFTVFKNGPGQITIDISKLAAGAYTVEYVSDTEIFRQKFVRMK